MAKRPTMPEADPSTATLFRTLLSNDRRVTVRPMFGHTAAFVSGAWRDRVCTDEGPAYEGVRATAFSDVG